MINKNRQSILISILITWSIAGFWNWMLTDKKKKMRIIQPLFFLLAPPRLFPRSATNWYGVSVGVCGLWSAAVPSQNMRRRTSPINIIVRGWLSRHRRRTLSYCKSQLAKKTLKTSSARTSAHALVPMPFWAFPSLSQVYSLVPLLLPTYTYFSPHRKISRKNRKNPSFLFPPHFKQPTSRPSQHCSPTTYTYICPCDRLRPDSLEFFACERSRQKISPLQLLASSIWQSSKSK